MSLFHLCQQWDGTHHENEKYWAKKGTSSAPPISANGRRTVVQKK